LFFHQDIIKVAHGFIQFLTQSRSTLRIAFARILANSTGSAAFSFGSTGSAAFSFGSAGSTGSAGIGALTDTALTFAIAAGLTHATDAAGKHNSATTISIAGTTLARAVATSTTG
jgi:hypothetical protein